MHTEAHDIQGIRNRERHNSRIEGPPTLTQGTCSATQVLSTPLTQALFLDPIQTPKPGVGGPEGANTLKHS
eukprot:scaffold35182_cov19-Tisochrysis_lutea.AAC.1